MTDRTIIDAGPSLNFFSVNKERLLFEAMGALATPETVRDEVLRKAGCDARFRPAEQVWHKLPDRLMTVLEDRGPQLEAVVARISGMPLGQRMTQGRDLGELMVVAHAVVAAEAGRAVTVLIDDGRGARLAELESRRLDRLRVTRASVGTLQLANTATVLQRAACGPHLPDRAAMQDLYRRLRDRDDGLVPIGQTELLSDSLWSGRDTKS